MLICPISTYVWFRLVWIQMFCIYRLGFLRSTHSIDIYTAAIKNIRNMHALSSNQSADILHFNDKCNYMSNNLGHKQSKTLSLSQYYHDFTSGSDNKYSHRGYSMTLFSKYAWRLKPAVLMSQWAGASKPSKASYSSLCKMQWINSSKSCEKNNWFAHPAHTNWFFSFFNMQICNQVQIVSHLVSYIKWQESNIAIICYSLELVAWLALTGKLITSNNS